MRISDWSSDLCSSDLVSSGAKRLQYLHTIDVRQHTIENDRVIKFGGGFYQAGSSINLVINDMTLLAQSLLNIGAKRRVVFDKKDLHFAPSIGPLIEPGRCHYLNEPEMPMKCRQDRKSF